MWKIDDRVTHRFNTDLGVGRIAALEGRNMVVEFAETKTVLRFGAGTDALVPWDERGLPSPEDSPVERLALGVVGSLDAFSVRLDAMHLAASRASDDLGSFLGGRIRLFPHQLDVALKATRQDPVRWLLADQVGLGKTVEACLNGRWSSPPRPSPCSGWASSGGSTTRSSCSSTKRAWQTSNGTSAEDSTRSTSTAEP
jgi:ATP-dependent helicase HepA